MLIVIRVLVILLWVICYGRGLRGGFMGLFFVGIIINVGWDCCFGLICVVVFYGCWIWYVRGGEILWGDGWSYDVGEGELKCVWICG